MKSIRITWSDKTTSETNINGTDEQIQNYYIGKVFNLGNAEHDLLLTAVNVEVLA